MKLLITVVAIVGWYFVLSMWHSLHAVAFRALDIQFTWFTVLFLLGGGLIAKVLLGGKG